MAGLIKGDNVSLAAGRDVNLQATTQSFQARDALRGMRGTVVDGVARLDTKNLEVQAGRDINAQTAVIYAEEDARLQAGRDINLTTTQTAYAEDYYRKKKNSANLDVTSEIGSRFSAGGDFTMIAGRDVNARAADVAAEGRLSVGAGRDINLEAGQKTTHTYVETYFKKKGFMSSRSRHTREQSDWTDSLSTTFTGDMLVMMAGQDVNITGSNAAAQNDMIVSADRNVNIVTAQNSSKDQYYEKTKKSGFGGMGGLSYGSRQTTRTVDTQRGLNTGSTLGSVEGDVLINAGSSLRVMGSDIIARQGDVSLVARDVTIGSVDNTMRQREVYETKQSGFTLTASNPIIDAAKTGVRMAEAAGKSDNPVMAGLAGVTTGLAASNAYDEVMAAPGAATAAADAKNKYAADAAKAAGQPAPTSGPTGDGAVSAIDKAGGGSIKISYGSSKSKTTTDRSSVTSAGSTVTAGNDLTIIARGAGSDSDITVTGSTLAAGNNAVLKADGDILLQAARNLYEEKTRSKSSGGSIGVGLSSGQQNGISIEAGMNMSSSKEDGKDKNWTNSNIVAGNILAIESGGNTTFSGAAGRADQIIASVGGNLLLESLQDSSRFKSSQTNAGFSVSLCVPPICYGSSSGSLTVGAGYMKSNFDSVTQQAGLWAGDGGFQIDVKGNTSLVGAVIGSSEKAVADRLNQLATGTLSTQDIKNEAEYKAAQVSLGMSPSLGKTTLSPPGVAAAFDNSKSTTESAISGGTIIIRDATAQQDLTGMTVSETIANLNRDTSDTLNALKPIFDKEKIEAGMEIALELQKQSGTFLSNRSAEIDALKTKANDEKASESERREAAAAAKALESKWGYGGDYRRFLNAVTAGASGNVVGSTGQFVQGAVANYLQALGAGEIKEITEALGDGADAAAARAALHGILACGTAAVGAGNCSSAAMGAASASLMAALLEAAAGPAQTAREKDSRLNLIVSLVAGASAGLSWEVASSTNAAVTELANNALFLSELKQYGAEASGCRQLGNCDEVQQRFRDLSIRNQEAIVSLCVQDANQCWQTYGELAENFEEFRKVFAELSATDMPSGLMLDLAIHFLRQKDAVNAVTSTEWAKRLQAAGASQYWAELAVTTAGAMSTGWALRKVAQGAASTDLAPATGIIASRVNVRTGDANVSSSGLEYAWKKHGGNWGPNKSAFTVSKDELKAILQSPTVVKTPAFASPSGNFIRTVDLGRPIGIDAKDGGRPTNFMTVITDSKGNLMNTFPGKTF
ncbi:hemagglutinin repeat-containing protein [Pseudomonadota bacterium AL_CKDN230030165-1A_HGKHYDSX7]